MYNGYIELSATDVAAEDDDTLAAEVAMGSSSSAQISSSVSLHTIPAAPEPGSCPSDCILATELHFSTSRTSFWCSFNSRTSAACRERACRIACCNACSELRRLSTRSVMLLWRTHSAKWKSYSSLKPSSLKYHDYIQK